MLCGCMVCVPFGGGGGGGGGDGRKGGVKGSPFPFPSHACFWVLFLYFLLGDTSLFLATLQFEIK